MPEHHPEIGAFGAAFEEFMRVMIQAAKYGESPLAARMREHLGQDPKELPSTSSDFASTEHANLQLGLDAVLPDAELLGYSSGGRRVVEGGTRVLGSGGP